MLSTANGEVDYEKTLRDREDVQTLMRFFLPNLLLRRRTKPQDTTTVFQTFLFVQWPGLVRESHSSKSSVVVVATWPG